MKTMRIADIGEVVSGATPRTDSPEYWGGDIPWVSPKELSDLQGQYLNTTVQRITRAGFDSCSTNMLPKGSVLFSSRAPIGLVAIAGLDLCTNQGFKSIIPNEGTDPLYLYYALKYHAPRLQALGTGTTFLELSKGKFADFKLPFPDTLVDQRRIAALLSRAEGLIAQRKESLLLLDELVRSVFLEMFGDPVRNEKGWERLRFEMIATVRTGPFGSLLHAHEYIEGGIPLVNPIHMREGKIHVDPQVSVLVAKAEELANYRLEEGDVVIARRGDIGRCAVVTKNEAGCLCGTGSLFVRPPQGASASFIAHMVSSEQFRNVLECAAKGVTMKNLSGTIIEALRVINPPQGLQVQFHQTINRINVFKEALIGNAEILDKLYGSLCQRAFRGELDLSQEHIDEPVDGPLDYQTKLGYVRARVLQEREQSHETKPTQQSKRERAEGRSQHAVPKTFALKGGAQHVSGEHFKPEFVEEVVRLMNVGSDYFSFEDFKSEVDKLKFKYEYTDLRDAIFKAMEGEGALLEQVFTKEDRDGYEEIPLERILLRMKH